MAINDNAPFYKHATFEVRDDLAEIHRTQLEDLGSPGTWGTGAQRLAVASEARQAGVEAGVMEAPANGLPAPGVTLPETVRTFIRKLAVSPKDVDEAVCDAARSDGLSDEEYVEIVGIVSRVVNIDIFARGVGAPLHPLPAARDGRPSCVRPESAVREHAIVPTVPNPPEGGRDAQELYGGKWQPYIMRALSLVPSELRDHLELEEVQYMPMDKVMVPDHQHHKGVTRAQAEVVAGRVSAINECFFWTTSHARFLRESGHATNIDVNPMALVDPRQDPGVVGGHQLLEFADALLGTDRGVLNRARVAMANVMGGEAIAGIAAVAATFSMNDRIANACGIPVEPMVLKTTKDLREAMGLNSYRSAAYTFKHFQDA